MTRLLEQAINRLRNISDADQDRFAQLLLAELDDDARWSTTTAEHAPALQRHLQDLLKADASGQLETLDPDTL